MSLEQPATLVAPITSQQSEFNSSDQFFYPHSSRVSRLEDKSQVLDRLSLYSRVKESITYAVVAHEISSYPWAKD